VNVKVLIASVAGLALVACKADPPQVPDAGAAVVVAAPSAPAQLKIQGVVTEEMVKQAVAAKSAAFGVCTASYLAAHPAAHETVVVNFVVRPDGSVHSPAVRSSTAGNPEMETCLEKVFPTLEFPKSHSVSTVAYPLVVGQAG